MFLGWNMDIEWNELCKKYEHFINDKVFLYMVSTFNGYRSIPWMKDINKETDVNALIKKLNKKYNKMILEFLKKQNINRERSYWVREWDIIEYIFSYNKTRRVWIVTGAWLSSNNSAYILFEWNDEISELTAEHCNVILEAEKSGFIEKIFANHV